MDLRVLEEERKKIKQVLRKKTGRNTNTSKKHMLFKEMPGDIPEQKTHCF
jgi:hypothetical protein